MSMERRMSFGQDRRTWRKKFKNDSNDNNESKSKETSRNQSRDQSMDLKDEEMPLESGDSSRLQIAVGAFQRKYRSMSVYGEHVIDIAERSKKALFIFPERNSIRMFCKRVVENKIFEYFILLTIATNCVVLMIAKPLPNDDLTKLNAQLENADAVFVAIFTLEAILKIIAYGFFFHSDSYLRSGWNILDFVVVVVGLVQVSSLSNDSDTKRNSESIRALRAIRVLRPLKLVSGIPSLQVVMKSLIRAMVPLLQILLLVLFVIVIYAIVGLELLRDSFNFTCFRNTSSGFVLALNADERPRPCDKKNGWGRACGFGEICRKASPSEWEGPNDGITTFDNMFLAMLTVFQCITLEGWSDVLYLTIDAKNQKYSLITWGAFTLLIVIGSFFMLNLVLGVLSGEFAKERERVEKRKSFMKLRRQRQLDRQVDQYLDWINKAEEIILTDEVFEDNKEDPLGTQLATASQNVMTPGCSTRQLLQEEKEELKNMQNSVMSQNMITTPRKKKSCFLMIKKCEKRFRLLIRKLSKNQIFNWAVLVLVFLNTAVMSLQEYGQEEWLSRLLDLSEKVFTALFFAEMLLRVYGLGLKVYLRSAFNKFDFTVVWLSIGDLILYKYANEELGISVLRSFRLLRVFKITRFWRSMQNVVTSLMNSIKSILSLILLLLLFILIFALLGMQLFGGMFHKSMTQARTNFDDFVKAMLAVFQIMTGEDWNSVMYNGISAAGGPKSFKGMLVSLYFVALVIIGNYTLLNVFLAIAVDNLANAQALTRDEELEMKKQEEAKQMRRKKMNEDKWSKVRAVPKILAIRRRSDMNDNPFSGMTFQRRDQNNTRKRPADVSKQKESAGAEKLCDVVFEYRRTKKDAASLGESSQRTGEASQRTRNRSRPHGSGSSQTKILQRRQLSAVKIIHGRSLFLFSTNNRFRLFCHSLVSLKHFDHIMLVIIILSSIILAMEDPLVVSSKHNDLLRDIDIAFVSIFTFEVLLKIVAHGFILHKGSYLRDWWNVIDTFIVACNITAIVLSYQGDDLASGGGQTLKSMRVLRVFRPLRVVNKLEKLKVVFQCMVFSLKRVINIIIITMLCLFMFAVIGVHLFQGKFQSCNDVTKLTREECQGEFFMMKNWHLSELAVLPRVWKTFEFNFDTVPSAMLTLFTSATGEDWPRVMHLTIDSTKVDHGPVLDNRVHMSLYYVCFVVIFSFFFLNIFVALIIVTFQERGERELTGCELTKNQRACLQFVLQAKPRQRFMPQNKDGVCYKVWRVVDSKLFEIAIMTLIALNAIVLMLSTADESPTYRDTLEMLNLFFTLIFTLEACLKLIAYKLNYFRDGWNVFDFLIVFMTLIGAFVNHYKNDSTIDPSFFRLFRAFRLIKLLKQGYNIRVLLWTFLQSFKALPYVMLLILMLFFIYAVIGMQLFGRVKLDRKTQLNDFNNFTSFSKALQVLFRCATGEAWHMVMLACSSHAVCYDDESKICGSTIAASIYFCSFYFFCSFLLLNLFVAVIMDNFDYLTRDKSILGPHHMDEFVRVWSEYDPSASGRIPHTEVYYLMCDMQPPVGFGRKCPKFLAYKRLMRMNMPVSGDNTVLFRTTLFALVRTSMNMTPKDKGCFRDNNFRRIIRKLWPNTTQRMLDVILPEQSVLSSQQITIGKIYAAKLIYESFKEMKRRRGSSTSTETAHEGNSQKRGTSILRKMIGVFRTSSHPLRLNADGQKKPEQSYLAQRRRSKSFDAFPIFTGLEDAHKTPPTDARVKRTQWRSRSLRLGTLTDPEDSFDFDEDEMRQSSISRATGMTDISPRGESPPTRIDLVEEKNSTRITDSLITALRDPSKPILCFVNSHLPQERLEERGDVHARHRPVRPRASTLTVSLPMIKLEIPVEHDEDIMNMSISREDVEQFLPQAANDSIPDLILSATGIQRPRTYSGQSLGKESVSSMSNPSGECSSMAENSNNEFQRGTTEVTVHRNDFNVPKSEPCEKSEIAKKRDSLRRSKQLHAAISDDSPIHPKRRRAFEREAELAESSLEDLQLLSMEEKQCADESVGKNRDNLSSFIIANTDAAEPTFHNDNTSLSDNNTIELQFLRTLQSEINRAAQAPRRVLDFDPKANDDETWC
ncbi:voltage-dependent L-type calcium channel subunit alpha-1D-like [Rhopilema esculentum]|uniref:voltage-dependent L-type calcium channel subunit alpha-1D-like n=1 Tax=Rhopilema esculentum TaxID=499914 RepID=UPI0031E270E3